MRATRLTPGLKLIGGVSADLDILTQIDQVEGRNLPPEMLEPTIFKFDKLTSYKDEILLPQTQTNGNSIIMYSEI